jgi:hypothetical protein
MYTYSVWCTTAWWYSTSYIGAVFLSHRSGSIVDELYSSFF